MRVKTQALLLSVVCATLLAACGGNATSSTESTSASAPSASAVASGSDDCTSTVDAQLAALDGAVLGKGQNGETPAPASSVDLTPEQVEQVKSLKAKAAIVMHYGGNDWSTAQIQGMQDRFAELGVEVVAVTDANFKPDKQVSDIETVMSQSPNVIVSIPTDPVATAQAYMNAAAAGAKIVFIGNTPAGMSAGKDYVGVSAADDAGNGVASALMLAKSLNCVGKVGLVFHDADFFVTKQRYDAVKETLAKFPGIEIVDEKGIAGPDFAGDAQAATNAMLTKFPDLNGIWAVWDVPAEGVLAAARASGRSDVKVTTIDLGTNVAVALAANDMVVGVGAQRPYDLGVVEANMAAQALLGADVPPVVLGAPALPVDHASVLDAWTTVYRADPPASLADSYVP